MALSIEDSPQTAHDPRKRVRLLKRLAGRFTASAGSPLVAGTVADDGAPLSFSQQQLWVLDRINPGKPTYNIVGSALFTGPFRSEILAAAFNEIIRRHSALRATFRMQGSKPAQFIAPFEPYDVPVIDLAELPQAQRDAEVARLAEQEARKPFDLETGPLVRGQILKLGPDQHAFLLTFHHIIVDAWSMSVFTDELALQYEALLSGAPAVLPALAVQYADYAAWQRTVVDDERIVGQLTYWKEKLDGAPSVLDLPTDRPRPAVPTYGGGRPSFEISADVMREFKALGKRNGATLFATLLTAFYVLLARYSGRDDIVVGTPNAGRNRPEIADLMGYFVNTLALRVDLSGDPTFVELLASVKATVQEAYAHADAPFQKVVEAVAPERTVASPLVGVMFSLEESFGTWSFLPDIAMTPLNAQTGTAIGDLMLWCVSRADGSLQTQFEYSADLFDEATIARLAAHFQTLLESIVRDPATPISQLRLLEPSERREILRLGTGSRLERNIDGCVHERFAAQVERTPTAVAVSEGSSSLTYHQLNERADRVAAVLAERGAGPGTLVGLFIGRSIDAIVGMLAILKTGAAYLPLDPEYPADRIAFMLDDAHVTILCVDAPQVERLPSYGGTVVDVPGVSLAEGNHSAPAREYAAVSPQDPAYVVYTSGSTGQPKGVVAPHRAVTNLVIDTDYVDIGPTDTIAQLATLSFDAATFEIWGPLLNGARLVICPGATALSPPDFAEFLVREEVSVMFLTTALFQVIVRSQPTAFAGIRTLLVGGEQLDPQAVRTVIDAGRPQRLFNIYGPTETTTFACAYEITGVDENARRIPIGRPIAGTSAYVLDSAQHPVPFGVAGELCIGGRGVADRYLDRPELTAQRFIPDPFSDDPDARLYRTGDRFRLLPTGYLDILGRFDNQVKLRGFRVEPGEIETTLRRQANVEAAVVITDGADEARRLLAFVVPQENAGTLNASDLRAALGASLPNYMVPSVITIVDRLPLTPNGKIDTRALLLTARDPAANTVSLPNSQLQHRLLGIWKDVLGVPVIGTHDDFFELGGNSLLAVRMLEEVERLCGRRVPAAELFKTPTIAHLDAVMMDQLRERENPLYIALRDTGTKAPFFLFHGYGVPAFYGRSIAKVLEADQPFFVLVPHNFESPEIPPTVEAMADDYMAVLRSVRPHGPYSLGGFCMSGLIAFEVALRLTAAGEKIEHLALIDTFPGGIHLRWLEALLRRLEPVGLDLWRRQRILGAASRWRFALREATRENQFSLKHLRYALKLRWTFREILFDDIGRGTDRAYWLEKIARSYIPKRKYGGRVSLLACEQARANVPNDPTAGWKSLCAGVDLYPLPGMHREIIAKNLNYVTKYLREILDKEPA